jgi:hypothetical protein
VLKSNKAYNVRHRGRIHMYAIRKVQYKVIRGIFNGSHYYLLCTKGFKLLGENVNTT